MPHPKRRKVANDRFPRVRHHKPSGRAAVVLNGHWFYLGPWGPDAEEPCAEARAAYDKLLARWLAGGREPLSDDDPAGRNPAALARLEVAAQSLGRESSSKVTVTELVARFWQARSARLEPVVRERYRTALRQLRELAPDLRAEAFGYAQLRELRICFEESRQSRPRTLLNIIRKVFRWGVSVGLLPTAVMDALGEDEPEELTVAELIEQYLCWAEGYYLASDGRVLREVQHLRGTLNLLGKSHGETVAGEFGPVELGRLQLQWIEDGLALATIRDRIGRIRRVFRWAVSRQLIPSTVHEALRSIEPVKAGRCGVQKPRRVRPVSLADVQAIQPYLSDQVAAMIWLQWWTAARPGEICSMRGCDLNTSGEVWLYQPFHHKTEHFGKDRRIAIGPEGQKVLRSFLRPGKVCLFSPREAEQKRRQKLMDQRTAPLTNSHLRARVAKRKDHPRRKPGERYTVESYGREIRRACELAGIPRWTPNQLRHSACTRIEREAGIEEARKVAGHAHARTTAIYAETEWQDIVKIMKHLG